MLKIKRRQKTEERYSPRMGRLSCQVTRIYRTMFGIPIQKLHQYRETYHGEVKEESKCVLSKI